MCSAHNVAIYIGIRELNRHKKICSVLIINSGNFEFVFLPYYGMKKVLVLKKTTLNAYFRWLSAGGLFDIIQSFVLKENQQRGLQQSNFFCVWHFLGVLSLSLSPLTFQIQEEDTSCWAAIASSSWNTRHLLSSMILIENVIGQQIERPIYKYYDTSLKAEFRQDINGGFASRNGTISFLMEVCHQKSK